MRSHNLQFKATQHSSLYHKVGMKIFFHQYNLLEKANFPLWTGGNYACWAMIIANAYWRFVVLAPDESAPRIYKVIASFNIAVFFTAFFGLTYVFVAPTIGRIIQIRRCFLVLVEYLLFRFLENLDYLTGANIHGYLPHLTAHKMLDYGYVTPQEMDAVSSLAIVRNPYSRMVSIYMYNRFGSQETFQQFVKSWYQNMKYYRESGEMEEWYTPCHVIPQFEYTHFEGSQLVQSIVKQEELKFLKHRNDLDNAPVEDSSVRDLPQAVRDALLGMPHANKRKTSKPWYELYDQETLDLTYEMYSVDFEIFEYSTTIQQRPDLHAPQVSESLARSVARSSANGTYNTPPRTIPSTTSTIEPLSKTKTKQDQTTTIDDDPPMPPTAPSTPQPILFESFSRDASSEITSLERKQRRSSLLSKSARVSSRRSSMAGSVSSTHHLNGDINARELSELSKSLHYDDDSNTGGGQKKND